MKINNKNELYIQKIDLLYLIESHMPVPESIYLKTKRNVINDHNKYKFLKFTIPDDISFLNKVPWIIDYNDIKDLSIEEISQMINKLSAQKEVLRKEISNINNPQRLNIIIEIQEIRLKIYSLTEILWYKYGSTKVSFPKKVKSKHNISKKIIDKE